MTDQKNSNQVVIELKWLDAKEPDPSSLNLKELRGRKMSMRNHISHLEDSHPHAENVYIVQYKVEEKYICLPPPIKVP